MESTVDYNKRICAACDSETTYITKKGKHCWHKWDGYWICHACRSRYIDAPICHQKWGKIHVARYGPRTIRFKNRAIVLKENPRKGICVGCGKTGLTHIHHVEYHEDDPLRDAIEICPACHAKETNRAGQVLHRHNIHDPVTGRFTPQC